MTILSDRDIRAAIDSGEIVIEGLRAIGPASVDVYLDSSFVHLGTESHPVLGGPCVRIESLGFMLASTVEVVRLSAGIAAQVHGCSSIGRTGLFVQNAGWVDPSFQGQITMEIFNASMGAIDLCPGDRIGQLTFHRLSSASERPYGSPGVGRYQGQRGATAAREPRRDV